jgi:hypothetical protein
VLLDNHLSYWRRVAVFGRSVRHDDNSAEVDMTARALMLLETQNVRLVAMMVAASSHMTVRRAEI